MEEQNISKLLCYKIKAAESTRRVNQQVQNYKTYLKNSRFGVE